MNLDFKIIIKKNELLNAISLKFDIFFKRMKKV